MSEEDRWRKVEEIFERVCRRVVKEELSALGKKPKITLVGGKWIGITQEQKEAWGAAYGAVDLEAELRRAAAWCVSNPNLAPTSQVGRFLNSWLTKEQNRLSLRSIPTERATETKLKLCSYCSKVATGSVNNLWSCDEHGRDALDRKPPVRMLGVVAKPVSGS